MQGRDAHGGRHLHLSKARGGGVGGIANTWFIAY